MANIVTFNPFGGPYGYSIGNHKTTISIEIIPKRGQFSLDTGIREIGLIIIYAWPWTLVTGFLFLVL